MSETHSHTGTQQYNFHKLLSSSSAIHLPPSLQKISDATASGLPVRQKRESEKIQVVLNIQASGEKPSSCISVDTTSSIVTLSDSGRKSIPSSQHKTSKSFPVDTVINTDSSQIEICSNVLSDSIQTVTNGEDATILSFGNSGSSTSPMLGNDTSLVSMGIIPTAICWLYKFVGLARDQYADRYSVRISAAEITSTTELFRDLLSTVDQYSSSPSAAEPTGAETESSQLPLPSASSSSSSPLLSSSPSSSFISSHSNMVEVRAISAERALSLLDKALSERTSKSDGELSHLFITLHLYQYHIKSSDGISGGRSRLHLIDLDCRKNVSEPTLSDEDSVNKKPEIGSTLQSVSKIILGVWTGQRHVPEEGSKLYQMLCTVATPTSTVAHCSGPCQTVLLFRISNQESHYLQNLQLLQFASKLYRTKIRQARIMSLISTNGDTCSSHDSVDSFTLRRVSKKVLQLQENQQQQQQQQQSKQQQQQQFQQNPYQNIQLNQLTKEDVVKMRESRRGRTASISHNRRSNGRRASSACLSSDVEALMTSSSEVSLDTVIYRGGTPSHDNESRPYRLKCRGSTPSPPTLLDSLGPLNIIKGKHDEIVTSKHRKNTNHNAEQDERKGNSGSRPNQTSIAHLKKKSAWPKTAMKRAMEVMQSGQELWVDGPEAFCQNTTKPNTAGVSEKVQSDEQNTNSYSTKEDQQQASTGHHKSGGPCISRFKNDMVSNWLSKQPYISLATDDDMFAFNIKNRHDLETKFHLNNKNEKDQDTNSYIDLIYSAEALQHTSSNFSRIEEWIKSVSLESPRKSQLVANNQSVSVNPSMTQSLHYPSASPFHNVTTNLPNYPHTNLIDCMALATTTTTSYPNPQYNRLSNSFRRGSISHDRSQAFRYPNISGAKEYSKKMCKMSKLKSNETGNNCRFSTLPLDVHSPKHKKLAALNEKYDADQNTLQEGKRNNKDSKKKESKKGFSFFNQLIRNKKIRKETSNIKESNQLRKAADRCLIESNEYAQKAGPPLILTSPYHLVGPNTIVNNNLTDSSGHGSDCSSLKTAQVLVVSAATGATVTNSNFPIQSISNSVTDNANINSGITGNSMGNSNAGNNNIGSTVANKLGSPGSNSSHGNIRNTITSIQPNSAHPNPPSTTGVGTTGFKYVLCRRAGSSGYESIVRDSELSSSHNDSTSESSVPPATYCTQLNQTGKVKANQSTKPNSIRTTPEQKPKEIDNENEILSHSNDKMSSPISPSTTSPLCIPKNESQKVLELIRNEKMKLLLSEREEMKNELLSILKYFNTDHDNVRQELDRQLEELESGCQGSTLESIISTNNTLRSVLQRYQSSLCMVTSFIPSRNQSSFNNEATSNASGNNDSFNR